MSTITPIDHNPFSDPKLIQVDHDPFDPRAEVASMPATNPIYEGLVRMGRDLLDMPRRLIEANQAYIDASNMPDGAERDAARAETGRWLAGKSLGAAGLTMGTGVIAGVPVRGGEAVLGAGPIRAYHGSPYDFDRFDTSKIGTGQGAQSFGHGMYFAENPKVAQHYKDTLTQPVRTTGHAHIQNLGGKYHVVDDFGVQAGPFDTKAEALASMNKKSGRMYEVNINANPEHFLDWDKPLSQQHPQTQEAVKKAMGIDYYGKFDQAKSDRLWNQFKNSNAGTAVRQGFIASDDKLVAQLAKDAGIPGIKYLDQGSRAAKDHGSRNYVVFDDKIIDILKKYGIAGLSMLPPATAAFLSQKIKPVDHDPFNKDQSM